MWTFVYWLKLLATVLITNSHFSGVWPISALATGGMLGNVIFFAVSGFCLAEVKDGFLKFMGKRALRIFPSMLLFSFFAAAIGQYPLTSLYDFVYFFRRYIFLVWMIILCIPFYFVAKLGKKYKSTLECALMITAVLWLATYLIFVDKTNYVVDTVESPFIMYLYFAAMLVGALFKKQAEDVRALGFWHFAFALCGMAVYFATKLLFVKVQKLAFLQPINQLTIIIALVLIFRLALASEQILNKLNKHVNSAVKLISSFTLQIYVVQFLIIGRFSSLVFPLNLGVIVSLILVSGAGLFYTDKYLQKGIYKAVKAITKPRKGK